MLLLQPISGLPLVTFELSWTKLPSRKGHQSLILYEKDVAATINPYTNDFST